jgi:hypothetical protein
METKAMKLGIITRRSVREAFEAQARTFDVSPRELDTMDAVDFPLAMARKALRCARETVRP